MKHLFFALLLIGFIWSCTPDDSSKENIALIENYIKAVENLDYDAMDQAISNWKYNVENLYEKISYSKSKNIAAKTSQGEWVSTWADLAIVFKNDKKEIKILTNTIYQIENGKIKKSITFYNEADALEQLGYVFINPEDLQ